LSVACLGGHVDVVRWLVEEGGSDVKAATNVVSDGAAVCACSIDTSACVEPTI
jgi:hypothetical protein